MNSEEDKNTNSKSLLRAGFILSGIAIIIAAISLIFLDLYDNAFFSAPNFNSSNNNGDLVIIFLLITIAMIFFLILGILVIRIANSLNYGKTTMLGVMTIIMFIFLGISDFVFASFISGLSSSIASSDQTSGVLAIIGGVFIGTALIVAANRSKISKLTAAILGLIGMPMIYFSVFYIPNAIVNVTSSITNTLSSHTFLLNVFYSFFIPSHILFPTGFFLSYDYIGLIAGVLIAIVIIISSFENLNKNISSLLSYLSLLIFSIGEVITGVLLLISTSVNNFSNSTNPVYLYTNSLSQSPTGLISLYSVFQYLAIVFGILALISGVLLLIYFAMNIVRVITPLKEMIEPQPTKTENKATNTGTPDIKEKLTVLKEQFDNGLITKEDYDMMKEDLLNKL